MKKAARVRFLLLVLALEAAVATTLYSSRIVEWGAENLPSRFIRQAPARPVARVQPYTVITRYPFENAASVARWDEKIFRGKSDYRVVEGQEGGAYLEGTSRAASSGLFMKIDQKALPELYLDWRWRARKFPQKKGRERLADRSQDDFAARIYVIFAGTNFFNTRVIEYIWDEKLPVGTASSSPFSGNVKLFVVASGPASADGWRHEERNIRDDYKRLFNSDPEKPIAAIALMTDSDNTGSETAADFGDFVLKVKKTKENP